MRTGRSIKTNPVGWKVIKEITCTPVFGSSPSVHYVHRWTTGVSVVEEGV